ncbi:hypothetical protein [Streptomyces xanthophaeus]|uniref:hypothetical protein n=1 Tax=Streptomyces xanthophaeus TaxID=67385 RepID=UPI00131C1EF2|nr:hypothetical protein [Streptomyces xanthophaeus]
MAPVQRAPAARPPAAARRRPATAGAGRAAAPAGYRAVSASIQASAAARSGPVHAEKWNSNCRQARVDRAAEADRRAAARNAPGARVSQPGRG